MSLDYNKCQNAQHYINTIKSIAPFQIFFSSLKLTNQKRQMASIDPWDISTIITFDFISRAPFFPVQVIVGDMRFFFISFYTKEGREKKGGRKKQL